MATPRTSDIRRFKGETVYDWESEPADERPTEFGASTGFSTYSGYFHTTADSSLERRRRAARRYRRKGSGGLVLGVVVVMAVVTGLLYVASKVLAAFR
ncbi:MAG: hypothetical protein AB1430_24000 [Pseudomonadota bacterium]